MTNTQNPNEKIKAIEDFLEKYKLALLFNQHKISNILNSSLTEEEKIKPTDKMMQIFNGIVNEKNQSVSMLDDLSAVTSGPRCAIMRTLLRQTPNISEILPFRYMSLKSVIEKLKATTQTEWSYARKSITLEDGYDHSKHDFSGYFLLKGVPQEEAENTALKIDVENLRWGEAIPVSKIVLTELLNENYLANEKYDLMFDVEKNKLFFSHHTIASKKVACEYLLHCIDLTYAFNGSNVPKAHPVELDSISFDNRNCNYSLYENALIEVFSDFLASRPEIVIDRLTKKMAYIAEKQTTNEESENFFTVTERE